MYPNSQVVELRYAKFIPNNIKKPIIQFGLSLFFNYSFSCLRSSSRGNLGDTGSLAGIQSMASAKYSREQKKQKMSKIREMALKETALSIGAQSGLAWRAKIIDEALTKQARNLDAIYDFNSLTLEHNILPPVLLEGRKTLI